MAFPVTAYLARSSSDCELGFQPVLVVVVLMHCQDDCRFLPLVTIKSLLPYLTDIRSCSFGYVDLAASQDTFALVVGQMSHLASLECWLVRSYSLK